MAVRKLDPAAVDARAGVTMKSDPTRIDPKKLKLGKSVARHDPRALLLASYLTPAPALLGLIGAWLVWKPPSPLPRGPAAGKPVRRCDWKSGHWARLVLFSAILTFAVTLGLWSTEVLYGEQIVYSFNSQGNSAAQK